MSGSRSSGPFNLTPFKSVDPERSVVSSFERNAAIFTSIIIGDPRINVLSRQIRHRSDERATRCLSNAETDWTGTFGRLGGGCMMGVESRSSRVPSLCKTPPFARGKESLVGRLLSSAHSVRAIGTTRIRGKHKQDSFNQTGEGRRYCSSFLQKSWVVTAPHGWKGDPP